MLVTIYGEIGALDVGASHYYSPHRWCLGLLQKTQKRTLVPNLLLGSPAQDGSLWYNGDNKITAEHIEAADIKTRS